MFKYFNIVYILKLHSENISSDLVELLLQFEESSPAHYLFASLVESNQLKNSTISKIVNINSSPNQELIKHLKVADLICFIGEDFEDDFMLNIYDYIPLDAKIISINDLNNKLFRPDFISSKTSIIDSIHDLQSYLLRD